MGFRDFLRPKKIVDKNGKITTVHVSEPKANGKSGHQVLNSPPPSSASHSNNFFGKMKSADSKVEDISKLHDGATGVIKAVGKAMSSDDIASISDGLGIVGGAFSSFGAISISNLSKNLELSKEAVKRGKELRKAKSAFDARPDSYAAKDRMAKAKLLFVESILKSVTSTKNTLSDADAITNAVGGRPAAVVSATTKLALTVVQMTIEKHKDSIKKEYAGMTSIDRIGKYTDDIDRVLEDIEWQVANSHELVKKIKLMEPETGLNALENTKFAKELMRVYQEQGFTYYEAEKKVLDLSNDALDQHTKIVNNRDRPSTFKPNGV